MNTEIQDYLGVIRQLPHPTLAQTERFAGYVSSAHSWYKHLPVDPKVPFVFYLDPCAGMNRIQTRTGETALVEITDESSRFHYTWQKTEDYRRRFGYWNYHATYGTSFQFAGDGGVVNTARPGLKILTESGECVSVPPDLAEKGTALVSAFVHPFPNFSIWAKDPAKFGLSAIPDTAPHTTALGRLWRAFWSLWHISQQNQLAPPEAGGSIQFFQLNARLRYVLQQNHRTRPDPWEVDTSIPRQAMELIQRTVAELRESMDYLLPGEKNWDWPDERWLDQLQVLGVEPSRLSAIVKYVEVERLRALAPAKTQSSPKEFPVGPSVEMDALVNDIMKERVRQLAAMTDAMGRFVEAVITS